MTIKKAIYKHYKGNLYEVIDIATHSETLEELVIYRAIEQLDKLWVRPLAMFEENILFKEKYQPRFKLYTKENLTK